MKRILTGMAVIAIMAGCSNGGEKKDNSGGDSAELTIEQESDLANQMSSDIESDTQEVKQVTEENLQEIDSLLEDF